MSDWGLMTADGHHWLISDGDFPFDNCDDRCTSDAARERNRRNWKRRRENAAKLEREAAARGMTVNQLLSDQVSGVF